jgi:hypothetical protein
MNSISKRNYLYILLLALCGIVFSCACGNKDVDIPDEKTPALNGAAQTMQQLWETSPLVVDAKRLNAFAKIQRYADNCPSGYFKTYFKSANDACESMEKYDSVLTCYRYSFDRVLEGIKTERVEEGTVVIWMLYNMGYVIKTASGCFAIDIYHRWAKQLAPYLDFLCVTHNHTDHFSSDLIQEMFDANKPVLSNYLKKGTGYAYTSTTDKNYIIGKFSIRTAITDHNGTAEGKNFVTVFRIDCGDDAGHFTFLHIGDSNFKTSQYVNVQGALDVLIPRYAPVPHGGDENLIIGAGSGQVQPDYVLLSHILELGHDGVENSRWPLDMALERAAGINCVRTYVPMWGEKLTWKNNQLR